MKDFRRAVGEPSARFRLAAADEVESHGTFGPIAKVGMARLDAEMRQVDQGHGIGGTDTEDSAGGERQEPLARAQDGEGAEKPLAIHDLVPIRHGAGVAGEPRRGKVTGLPRACDGLTR